MNPVSENARRSHSFQGPFRFFFVSRRVCAAISFPRPLCVGVNLACLADRPLRSALLHLLWAWLRLVLRWSFSLPLLCKPFQKERFRSCVLRGSGNILSARTPVGANLSKGPLASSTALHAARLGEHPVCENARRSQSFQRPSRFFDSACCEARRTSCLRERPSGPIFPKAFPLLLPFT